MLSTPKQQIFPLKYKAHNVCVWKSQFHFVLGLRVQNYFNKSSTEYLMRFYIICQNWSKLCKYFSPPCFISIEKSNEIRLLCFLFKNNYFCWLLPTQIASSLLSLQICSLTMVMVDVIHIQTFVTWDAHRFLLLHAFIHHLIIDCNWINQMATAKLSFVTYSRRQNSKCPHDVIFVKIPISAVKLMLKAGSLHIIKMFAE